MAFSVTATVILVGFLTPFREPKLNRLETVNEVFLMFLMYHFFCFTDFIGSAQTRELVGFSVIVTLLGFLAVFFIYLTVETVTLMKWRARKYYLIQRSLRRVRDSRGELLPRVKRRQLKMVDQVL